MASTRRTKRTALSLPPVGVRAEQQRRPGGPGTTGPAATDPVPRPRSKWEVEQPIRGAVVRAGLGEDVDDGLAVEEAIEKLVAAARPRVGETRRGLAEAFR
jgi:hypothetical protein